MIRHAAPQKNEDIVVTLSHQGETPRTPHDEERWGRRRGGDPSPRPLVKSVISDIPVGHLSDDPTIVNSTHSGNLAIFFPWRSSQNSLTLPSQKRAIRRGGAILPPSLCTYAFMPSHIFAPGTLPPGPGMAIGSGRRSNDCEDRVRSPHSSPVGRSGGRATPRRDNYHEDFFYRPYGFASSLLCSKKTHLWPSHAIHPLGAAAGAEGFRVSGRSFSLPYLKRARNAFPHHSRRGRVPSGPPG